MTSQEKALSTLKLIFYPDSKPGIRRRRCGRGWAYYLPTGELIRTPSERKRINALAIPPAYQNVWISPQENGHLQATGRDARNRKQYRYHPRFREFRNQNKFHQLVAFGHALPRIRSKVRRDLRLDGWPLEKVAAVAVRLLDRTGLRIGNPVYARDNASYGLTTLEEEHAEVHGSELHLEFPGKHGKTVNVDLHDARLSKLVDALQDLPGQELFHYFNGETWRPLLSEDVNTYLEGASEQDFTAKDFRTWHGTTSCASYVLRSDAPTAQKRWFESLDRTAKELNNTRRICEGYYVHPRIKELTAPDVAAKAEAANEPRNGLKKIESLVLNFLEN